MKILLTGKNGQVGWDLQRTLSTLGDVVACDREEMDLSNPGSIVNRITEVKPDLIINAAAYTAVDKAESDQDLAMAVNGIAPGIIAEQAKKVGASIIHYSTDYIFDGTQEIPYTEDDTPNPINVYGKSKLAGEKAVAAAGIPYCIFRTSWVFSHRGNNFVNTMLRLAKEKDNLRIIDDQVGSPTWSFTIAAVTSQIIAQQVSDITNFKHNMEEISGVYHLTSSEYTTWFKFAKLIFDNVKYIQKLDKQFKIPTIEAISTKDYPTPACRPLFSKLDTKKLERTFSLCLPDWANSLKLLLECKNI